MKKILFALMILTFVSVLAACQDDDPDTENDLPYSERLRLESDFEGKSFITDGIGEVELDTCMKGHETKFTEVGSTEVFNTRYIGIATPPIWTNPPEPWSYAALDFGCNILNNAERIVLQADPEGSRRDNTSTPRYLVYVWVDDGSGEFRNLNLILIEESFTDYTGGSSLYLETFLNAWFEAQKENNRIHGDYEDLDPRTG